MSKGDDTRATILEHALGLASELGLEGLTIGALATAVGMSKSGLYAHFESKEDLQCQVLDVAADRFVELVVAPALKQPRGLPRLHALFERWLRWEDEGVPGGCPFIAGATEYDDRPGPVRDRLVGHLSDLIDAIAQAARIAIGERHFRADLEVRQFAFEFYAILLSYHDFSRLFRAPDAVELARRAYTRLIQAAGGA